MSIEEKNQKVLDVLNAQTEPIGPTEIGRLIGERWCCLGNYGMSAPITPVLRRIGAVRVGNGKYLKPEIK